MMGAGSQSGGALLARKGVIVVTFNYRLDILGFLSTEDDAMPGNFGMMDQVLALKWVQENIASFGGDPNKVTIFGLSAGSSSISLHTISPLSKGLFQRAIMESGVSLCLWAIHHPVNRLSFTILTRLIAAKVGCSDYIWNSVRMRQCLQQVDVQVLMNATEKLRRDLNMDDTLFMPRVENTFGFPPDFPLRLLAEGQVNDVSTMRGFTSEENSMFLWDPNDRGISVYQFKYSVASAVSSLYAVRDSEYFKRELTRLYLNETSTDPYNTRAQVIAVLSEFTMIAPTLLELDFLTNTATGGNLGQNHYLFEFNHRPEFSTSEPWRGVLHGQERPFVFGVDDDRFRIYFPNVTAEDRAVGEGIQTLWTNFAKHGNPNGPTNNSSMQIIWKPYTTRSPNLLRINNDSRLVEYRKPEVKGLFFEMAQLLDTAIGSDVREVQVDNFCDTGSNDADTLAVTGLAKLYTALLLTYLLLSSFTKSV